MHDHILRLSGSRWARIIAALFLGFLIILFCVQMFNRAYRDNGYDFTSYLLSARALVSGGNPYDTGSPFTYIYPLFFAMLMLPLAAMPYWMANVIWYFLGIVCLAVIVRVVANVAHRQYPGLSLHNVLVPAAITLLFLTNTIQNNLLNGQVNLLVIVLCLIGFVFLEQGRDIAAGTLLAIAAAVKLMPFLFFFYFIAERKYTAAGVLVGVFFLCLLMPYLLVGERLFQFYRYYADTFLLHSAGQSQDDGLVFSLGGIVRGLVPASMVRTVSVLSLLLVLAGTLGLQHVNRNERDPVRRFQIFSLYFPAMLLMSPISETHHLVMVLPLLLMSVLVFGFGTGERGYVPLVVFGIFYLLGSVFETVPFYFVAILSLYWITFTPKIGVNTAGMETAIGR